MKFFRGYALIRGGTMAENTPCLKGVRLLGVVVFKSSTLWVLRTKNLDASSSQNNRTFIEALLAAGFKAK